MFAFIVICVCLFKGENHLEPHGFDASTAGHALKNYWNWALERPTGCAPLSHVMLHCKVRFAKL